ncbi:MAG: peptidyl-prolyl cis-trans isomerase [Puniceicoccaceae bacterium]
MTFRSILRRSFGALLLLTAASASLFAQQNVEERWEPDRPNAIAAKVEGKIITFEQIRREMAPLLNQVYRNSANDEQLRANLKRLEREVLQNLIDQILIIEDFKAREMEIPKSYLESEFNDVIQRDFNGERDRFLSYLRGQDKTVRDFRDELRDQIIVQVMKQRIRRNQAEISPEMIRKFYEENTNQFEREKEVDLHQITLLPDGGGDALEEKTAEVVAELEEGVPFPEVARTHSEDDLAPRGGSLGWTTRKDIRDELAEVAFSLEAGETSGPVPFRGNVLFFHVAEIRDAGPMPLSEVRDTIEEILLDRIARQAREKWIQRLREKAYIEYFI